MKKLHIVYQGWGEHWQLGTLADNGRELLFEYHPEALQQGLELSPRHLPLRAQAYGGFPTFQDKLPGLIADALPDGWGRLLMDKQFRRSGRDPVTVSVLERLAFIGERVMGALRFVPPLEAEPHTEPLSLLRIAEEAQHILNGEESSVLTQLAKLGGSPHGARPKVLANYAPGVIQASTDPASPGAPWLFKFPAQHEHPEVSAIEHCYAKLAAQCGIEMPETTYIALSSALSAFGIARFDRTNGMRVPTHTLAGLLHADFRMPSVDYTTFLRATRFLTGDQREVEKAFLRCVFNVVMHNRDDHAKNISFRLSQSRRWQLSPGYDLSFSEGPGGEHHMDVCGEGRTPGKAHLLQLAKLADVPVGTALMSIETVCTVAERFAVQARDCPIRAATVRKIDTLIKTQTARML